MDNKDTVGQHPASNLPNYGLSFTLQDLVKMEKNIHELPLEQQALFADQVCKTRARFLGFAQEQAPVLGYESFHIWNTTSVGNCAYMALHAPTPELREKYRSAVERYRQWRYDQAEKEEEICVIS
jgi:hypothetical protein